MRSIITNCYDCKRVVNHVFMHIFTSAFDSCVVSAIVYTTCTMSCMSGSSRLVLPGHTPSSNRALFPCIEVCTTLTPNNTVTSSLPQEIDPTNFFLYAQ